MEILRGLSVANANLDSPVHHAMLPVPLVLAMARSAQAMEVAKTVVFLLPLYLKLACAAAQLVLLEIGARPEVRPLVIRIRRSTLLYVQGVVHATVVLTSAAVTRQDGTLNLYARECFPDGSR